MALITTDNVWFSPINVMYHFSKLDDMTSLDKKTGKKFRKAYEANLVAIMLMGIIKLQQQEYWMQITKDSEGTPDIRTFRYVTKKGKANWQDIQEVEVVQYEKHSFESITDFLKRTKLSQKKSYPETTTILCLADKTINLPSWKKLHEELQDIKINNPVVILGKTHPTKTIYTICQIHPTIDLLAEYNIMEESFNKKYIGVLRVNLSAEGKLEFTKYPNEKHYPFDSLGIKTT